MLQFSKILSGKEIRMAQPATFQTALEQGYHIFLGFKIGERHRPKIIRRPLRRPVESLFVENLGITVNKFPFSRA